MTGPGPLRRTGLILAVGALTGLGGILVTLLLHGVQHLLFGYTGGTFLMGIVAAPDWRRVVGSCVAGLVVGLAWALLRRRGRPPPMGAVVHEGAPLPVLRSCADAVLQMVAVGGGASVGREGAPRQLGAVAAATLADRTGFTGTDRRVLVAAGVGGGLAAVYDVPLAGVVFAALLLLDRGDGDADGVSAPARRGHRWPGLRGWRPGLRPVDWLTIAGVCAVATVTAWTVLGRAPVYTVTDPDHAGSIAALLGWAVLAGPLAAALGLGLDAVARWATARQPAGLLRLPAATTTAMGLVGLAAIWWPTLPGNGKSLVEVGLAQPGLRDAVLLAGTSLTGWGATTALAVLVVLKLALTGLCLRAGITGGLLTPALSVGAAVGTAAATAALTLGLDVPVGCWALIGAAAVTAVSQRSALLAVVLVGELTGMPWRWVAVAALSAVIARFCAHLYGRHRSDQPR